MDTIKVDISFYDEVERKELLNYPTATEIQALVSKPLEIPQAEFLTYYLFHHIKLGKPGYRDYDTVANKVHLWLSAIAECIDYDAGSVRTPQGATGQLTEVSEHVGEAIGLSVVSRIHGLTEADWAPIAEQQGRNAKPSFDFQIASDGKQFVQVETKGSSVKDNRAFSDAVKAQKRRIDEKKTKLSAFAKNGTDPNPASLRYGTIVAIDSRQDGNVRCHLVDPPPERVDEDPSRFRLVTRMRRLRDWICFLSPRSVLASALATRVADLGVLKNPFELDSLPLSRGTGDRFDIIPYGILDSNHSSFMASKSRVSDGPAGGAVIQLSERALFFVGIREDLLVKAANQEFEGIISYKAEVDSISKTVECTFSPSRFTKLRLPESVTASAKKTDSYVSFPLDGKLQYSPDGLVFGVLPLPEE